MMRCARFERLAALALSAGARIVQRGNGGFVAQHQGQHFDLHSLREAEEWLASVAPEQGPAVAVAVLRDTRFQQAMRVARKQAKRERKQAMRVGGQP
jgi:hypothetical protein